MIIDQKYIKIEEAIKGMPFKTAEVQIKYTKKIIKGIIPETTKQ